MAFPFYNIKFVLLVSASFITIFSSIAIYFCLPILISHVLRTQISLSPSSGSFNDWRMNQVIDRIYLYNITNVDEIISASLKSTSNQDGTYPQPFRFKLEQIGPITFKQTREKLNIKFDPTNETVIYDQRKSWSFMPKLSVIDSLADLNETTIYHMNVPLAGTTLNAEFAEFIDPIVSEWDLKLFSNHSVNALLFEGYYDILMENAKSTGQVDSERFGWMHGQNNTITKNVRIFTGPSNSTLDKFGSIDQYNFKQKFETWNETEPSVAKRIKDPQYKSQCNDFRFSSAGEFFPPPLDSMISHYNNELYHQPPSVTEPEDNGLSSDLSGSSTRNQSQSTSNKRNNKQTESTHSDIRISVAPQIQQKIGKTISLFMPDLCRTFKLSYNYSYNYKDSLLVDRYIANQFTYKYSDSTESADNLSNEDRDHILSNECYCLRDLSAKITSCPPAGMMDLYTCRKGSPMTISFPYFHYSRQDASLKPYLNFLDESYGAVSTTNDEEHLFYIDLESTLNVPVKAQIVIQFNVHYRNEPSLHFTRDYSRLFDSHRQAQSKPMTDFYLPQIWIKSSAEIDDGNLNNLIFIQKHLGLVTPITTLTISAVALILLLMSAKLAYDLTYGPESRKSLSHEQESCSSSSRKNSQQYLEEKQKYYAMQLLGNEKFASDNNKSDRGGDNGPQEGCSSMTNHYEPTTSRTDESQPLNK